MTLRPHNSSAAKLAAVRAYGGQITLCAPTLAAREAAAAQIVADTRALFIHPYDDPDVIAGQGTIGLELADQVPGAETVLIPIGLVIVRRAEGHVSAPALEPSAVVRSPMFALAVAGLILMAAGIWLPVVTDGPTYWNASYSGHALGILLLLVVVANAAVLLLPLVSAVRVSADRVLFLACASFGLAAALWLETFNHLGVLGTGGWVEAMGGLLLAGGVVALRLTSARRARAPQALPAT